MGVMNDKLMALGYPSNIKELIEEAEGVSLEEETDTHYVIWDDYEDNDRFLQINKNPEVREGYFEFFNNQEVNKEDILKFANSLPPILFMHLKKVYFVKEDSDVEVLNEESPNHTFSFGNTLGMTVYNDSTAIINIRKSLELAKEEEQDDKEVLGYTNGWKSIFIDIIYQTLVHELFHLTQFNPLIEEHIEAGEEVAEEYCREFCDN